MNSKINVDQFIQFEDKYDLFNYIIDDVYIWSLIRFNIYRELMKLTGEFDDAQDTPKKISVVLNIFKQVPNMIFKNPFSGKEADILVFNHERRIKIKDRFYCAYTDLIIDQLSKTSSYIIIEEKYKESHYQPIPNDKVLYMDYIDLLILLRVHILKSIRKRKDNIDKIQYIIDIIKKEFNISLDESKWIKLINSHLFQYKLKYKYLKKIIRRVNPKVILEVVSYRFTNLIVNSVAKELGIPTIEMQHGTMGKDHIAYNYLKKEIMYTFPDRIFLFGRYWKENSRLPLQDEDIVNVGWTFYNNKLLKYKHSKKNNGKIVLLFISQGTIGKRLSEIAASLYNLVEEDKYHIIFKLHPGEYRRWISEYTELRNTGIEIIDTSNEDIHYYFNQADYQIGVYSTAIFEGLGYGLKTLICKLPGHEQMEQLIDGGLAKLIDTPEQIVSIIENNEEFNPNTNIDYFWEKRSLDSIVLEIKKTTTKKK